MSGAVLLGTGGTPSPTAPPLMATITALVSGVWFALVDGAVSANTLYPSAARQPVVGDRVAVQKVGNALVEIAVVKNAAFVLVDGTWTATGLNMPNVPMSPFFARYTTSANTFTYQAAVLLTGTVGGQVLIDLPGIFDWGPGIAALIAAGSSQLFPIGKMRAIRQGVSWYEGDVIPYSMKSGGTPARASVWRPGADSFGTSSDGGVWTSNVPATWAANDQMAFSFTTEVVRV